MNSLTDVKYDLTFFGKFRISGEVCPVRPGTVVWTTGGEEMAKDDQIRTRKADHLRIVAEEEVAHTSTTLLENVRLFHQALPELDLDAVDTSAEFFGRRLRAPLLITSMSGGTELAGSMNRDLATVAAEHGIGFGVGSQRVILDHPEALTDFTVRSHIPDSVLLANIGGAQLVQYDTEAIAGLKEQIEADAICVHLNAAQELVQPEGDCQFSGILEALGKLVKRLPGKVLVKETGAGLSPETLALLDRAGVTCVDVSGAGGTSWTRVEMHRETDDSSRQIAATFADWGIPTAFSIIAARRTCRPGTCIIGAGGIISGLDAARAIASGADLVGFARSVFLAYRKGGVHGADQYVDRVIRELKNAMVLTGSANVAALKLVPRVYTGELFRWLSAKGWHES